MYYEERAFNGAINVRKDVARDKQQAATSREGRKRWLLQAASDALCDLDQADANITGWPSATAL